MEVNNLDGGDPMFAELLERCNKTGIFDCHSRDKRRDAERTTVREVRNNGSLIGAKKSFADQVVGPEGPTFELIDDRNYQWTDEARDEYLWLLHHWLRSEIRAPESMHCMIETLHERGESCGFFHTVPANPHPNQLDRKLAQTDEERESLRSYPNSIGIHFSVKDAWRLDEDLNSQSNRLNRLMGQRTDERNPDESWYEGIRYDRFDRPVEYKFFAGDLEALKNHSILYHLDNDDNYEKKPAYLVTHLFEKDCAEQKRGWAWMAGAILPAALIRKTMFSIVKRIRNESMNFGYITSDAPPPNKKFKKKNSKGELVDCPAPEHKPNSTYKLHDGMVKALCGGAKFVSGTISTFSTGATNVLKQLTGLAGQAICAPLFRITGDYSDTNFVSGKLGDQPLDQRVNVWRERLKEDFCRKALRLFHIEAQAMGLFSEKVMVVLRANVMEPFQHPIEPSFKLHWDKKAPTMPLRDARAKEIMVGIGALDSADLVDGDFETKQRCEAQRMGISVKQLAIAQMFKRFGLNDKQMAIVLATGGTESLPEDTEEAIAQVSAQVSNALDDSEEQMMDSLMGIS